MSTALVPGVMAHGEVMTNVRREDTTLEEVTKLIVSY